MTVEELIREHAAPEAMQNMLGNVPGALKHEECVNMYHAAMLCAEYALGEYTTLYWLEVARLSMNIKTTHP